jgi:hypothetical protein
MPVRGGRSLVLGASVHLLRGCHGARGFRPNERFVATALSFE